MASTQRKLDKIVEELDDPLNAYLLRCNNYKEIQNKLESGEKVSVELIERLLGICTRDIKEDMQYTASALSLIHKLLEKIKLLPIDSPSILPSLIPSALGILHILKLTAGLEADALLILSIESIKAYPPFVITSLVDDHATAIYEVLELYLNKKSFVNKHSPIKQKDVLSYQLLAIILKLLPQNTKADFVKNGFRVWFNAAIPKLFEIAVLKYDDVEECISAVELLTECLIPHDYVDNIHWKGLLDSICNPKQYPAVLKKFVESESEYWHRLWILLIKLLKNQITKVTGSSGSPINSLLPVVELGYKMQPKIRCQAFLCWEALIDNFSTEITESQLNKRIKLLVVPLKSSNAKVEETTLAKFKTWWHLIRRYYSKMDKLVDVVLNPFLHFCFGKYANGRIVPSPGQFNDHIRKMCLQALVEITGHYQCEGCCEIPKLQGRLLTTKMLVDNWNDWLHYLKFSIQIAAKNNSDLVTKQITCLWKSLIYTIAEMPENNVRKDIFKELLATVLSQDTFKDFVENNVVDIVFKIFILSLFDDEEKFYSLLKTKQDEDGPLHRIIFVLVQPWFTDYFNSKENKELIIKLKRLTHFVLNTQYNSPEDILDKMCRELYPRITSMIIWTAFADTLSESNYVLRENTLRSFLLWPIKFLHLLPNDITSDAWSQWVTLHNSVISKVRSVLNKDITDLLLSNYKLIDSSSNFALCLALTLVKCRLMSNLCSDITTETDLTREIIKKSKPEIIIKNFPLINDTLVLLFNTASNSAITEPVLNILSVVLELLIPTLKSQSSNHHDILHFLELLFKEFESLLNTQIPTTYLSQIIQQLLEYLPLVNENSSIIEGIKAICNKCVLNKYKFNDSLTTKIKEVVSVKSPDRDQVACVEKFSEKPLNETLALDNFTIPKSTDPEQQINEVQTSANNFTTPNSKTSRRKSNKKTPNIVNTVVEDGEEFVVVKSNWKFNPKKLTENQKEKFKRKREDIPALYQDLSQSQDEFKLSTWKTDSQDTTTSTSSSKSNLVKPTNEDVETILKNIPCNDVVPSIIENITLDKAKHVSEITVPQMTEASTSSQPSVKSTSSKNKEIFDLSINNSIGKLKQDQTPRETKSPRMALKDRVFRNVRNLIEKSNLQIDTNFDSIQSDHDANENAPDTPVTKALSTSSVINSAPLKITLERPSRVIKKPKKFDDSELMLTKKLRRSQNDSQSDIQLSEKSFPIPDAAAIIEKQINSNPIVVLTHSIYISDQSSKKDVPKSKSSPEKCEEVSVIKFTDDCNNKVTTSQENVLKYNERNLEDDVTLRETDTKISENKEGTDRFTEKGNSNKCILNKSTPKSKKQSNENNQSTVKKKTSRIEKQLSIDMVEGHPFLQSAPEKRATRKSLLSPASEGRRRRIELTDNQNKLKTDGKEVGKKLKEKSPKKLKSLTISESENITESSQELPMSEDVIESSQDSSVTAISVSSSKHILTKRNVIKSDDKCSDESELIDNTEPLIKDFDNKVTPLSDISQSSNQECKEDIELSKNKTMLDQDELNATENMDTQPVEEKDSSGEVLIINDVSTPIMISTEDEEFNTQQIADADTQPMDIENSVVIAKESAIELNTESNTIKDNVEIKDAAVVTIDSTQDSNGKLSSDNLVTPVMVIPDSNGTCSPLKDDVQKKKDFLNDTIEISPIKTMSPVREKKSPSPDNSGDYVVIKLASPVQSNGEPFEKGESPEVFTEDKISPEKIDQSPPRPETVSTNNISPSSSLSLKKNRPQVRAGGRAAQMLGLCAPDKLQEIMNSERSNDSEETKKSGTVNTPARRNLRILYNTVNDNNDNLNESEDSENFLKLKRAIPTPDCSPAVPILKRKLVEIADEVSSPASKRKRVSFHDPPVSTTIAVQKYIEPGAIRSPQSSAIKRLERQCKFNANMKSPKRLDSVFKLENVLTKTVESFNDDPAPISNEDTQMSSIDQTPVVEVVKTSDLNDTDPICRDLLDCNDPIDIIACELSSPGMKDLFIKELKGKVETIADLAKLTELDVNRLCIKVPKVETAKKVLTDYATKRAVEHCENVFENDINEEPVSISVEIQTDDVISKDIEMQTNEIPLTIVSTQTEELPTFHSSSQTDESGYTPTNVVIKNCLTERPEFIDCLREQLPESSIMFLSEKLPANASFEVLLKKINATNSTNILDGIVAHQSTVNRSNKCSDKGKISFLQDYLVNKFSSKDLILLCSQLLQKIHDKPA